MKEKLNNHEALQYRFLEYECAAICEELIKRLTARSQVSQRIMEGESGMERLATQDTRARSGTWEGLGLVDTSLHYDLKVEGTTHKVRNIMVMNFTWI